MRNFIRGGKGFAPVPCASGAVVARGARALPRRLLGGVSASLRGLRPLPRRVRARFAARPRRLVASLRSLASAASRSVMKGQEASKTLAPIRASCRPDPAHQATAVIAAHGGDRIRK